MDVRSFSAVMFLLVATASVSASGAPPVLLVQERNNLPARNPTAAELAALGDPLFTLVLSKTEPKTYDALVAQIQPDATKRHVFVVHENLRDPRPRQVRRAVVSFSGETIGGEVLNGNLMLSVFFDSNEFPIAGSDIEGWGWDNHRGRYNYYRLDRSGTPADELIWKFRGSSVDADLLSNRDRAGTCVQCHANGGPVMKELLLPWNNWHSFSGTANYLAHGTPGAWPVAGSDHLRRSGQSGGLLGAERLESPIAGGIRQFNRRRINAALTRNDSDGNIRTTAEGMQSVREGRRLLAPLFKTTEVNLISAPVGSGLHPLPAASSTGPSANVEVPDTFLLNANLLAGGTLLSYAGLGIDAARGFGVSLTGAEYKQLVVDSRLQLARAQPADAHFAWFVPEPSHIDIDMVDQLVQRGIVSRHFAAAVLAVDLETPVFSADRERLLRFVPESWSFSPQPTSRASDELTTAVIAALAKSQPRDGTAEAKLLSRLRSANAVKALTDDVVAYRNRVTSALGDHARRLPELKRLFQKAIDARQSLARHPVLRALDETGDRLLPLP